MLYDDLSVREHAEYISRLHGGPGWDDYCDELAERLSLLDRVDDLPSRFSRGLRQKTSIILALIRPFSLMLVDEPFVGLDQGGKSALLELFDEVHDDGAALVVATHTPGVRRAGRSLHRAARRRGRLRRTSDRRRRHEARDGVAPGSARPGRRGRVGHHSYGTNSEGLPSSSDIRH